MAGINGMRALFSMGQVKEFVQGKADEFEQKAIETASFLGEEFVNKARSLNTYKDRTGNLRASIGYLIVYDGRIIKRNFKASRKGTDRKTGTEKAISFAEELAGSYPTGLILIGVAGMEYAAAVEAKGYDVITGSEPASEDFKKIFNEIEF